MSYINAIEGPPNFGSKAYTVHYFDEKGNLLIRSGGTKAWRNNNPGNMIYLPKGFASRHGAIGKAGGMAVFPSEIIGRKALSDLLKSSSYISLKIMEIPEKYDKSNAKEYRRMLLSISKLDPNKRVKDLSVKEFTHLQEAIERIEGWEKGREDFIEKWHITGVHKKNGVITEYLVNREKATWISKEKALRLAQESRLHATIVRLKNGTMYLRPEYGSSPFVKVT